MRTADADVVVSRRGQQQYELRRRDQKSGVSATR